MASYGVIRRTTIKGQAGTTWYVHLYKKDYTGNQLPMDLSGEGFNVKWSGSGGTRDRRFIESECVLDFIVQNNADESLLYDIFEQGDRNYFVRVYKNEETNNGLWWFGWVHPSFSTIENAPFPYKSKISSTDAIGTFKKAPDADLTPTQLSDTSNINQYIKEFGDSMGVYNTSTELIVDGDFPIPNVNWTFPSSWSIPTGGGQIDFDGSSGKIEQTGMSITQGDEISFSFSITNLIDGGSISLAIANQNGAFLLIGAYTVYTSNGNYVLKGTALQNATSIEIYPGTSGSSTFSLTDLSIIDNLITNPSPSLTNNNWFSTSVDWWRNGDTYQSDDPFYLYRIGRTLFRDNAEEFPTKYSKYKVLDGALKVFNTVGVLSNGRYNFIQPNQYANNTSGDLRLYQYDSGDSQDTTPITENHLLTLNGTTNANKGVVMGGSTLTYEPPFKSVSATFLNSTPLISIAPTIDFSNYGFVGNIQYDPSPTAGFLYLSFNFWHEEILLESEVLSGLTAGYDLANKSFKSTLTWNVKLTDGTQTKYLTYNSGFGGFYTWEDVEANNVRISGYDSNGNSNFNGSGGDSNVYPCRITHNNSGDDYLARTSDVLFLFQIPLPPFTGSVQLKLSGENEYYQWKDTDGTPSTYYGTIIPFDNTLLNTITHKNLYYYTIPPGNPNFPLTPSSITDSNSIALSEEVQGIKYTSNNSNVIAEEHFDFKNIVIGNTGSSTDSVNNPTQANVQYLNSNGVSSSALEGFRQGNSGSYKNITQLLCDEFLSLQTEPLEILQAEIFSPDISPLKLLKYSISDDELFKYYSFLGGSFGAQSETMKGEWFKINHSTDYTTSEDDIAAKSQTSPESNETQVKRLSYIESSVTNENALGILVSSIDAGTSFDKFNIDGVSLGRVYDNQKLIIRNPYNGEYVIATVNGSQAAGVSSINIDASIPNIGFPIGSTLSVLTYDLSNVIPESTTPNLYKGVTESAIYIRPDEFSTFNKVDYTIYSANSLGSVKPSTYTSGTHIYATTFVPIGYRVMSVDVYSSVNRALTITTCGITDSVRTAQGSGTSNTNLTLSTPWISVLGDYFIIRYSIGASTDEIYGAKLNISLNNG